MKRCTCREPRTIPNRKRPTCRYCAKLIDERWISSDDNTKKFLKEMANLPGIEQGFLDSFRTRESQARERKLNSFLTKDNVAEAQEQAIDLAIYCHLHILKSIKRGDEDSKVAAYDAAMHAALAFQSLARIRT
jgi:hypothetical protein